jgi:hypothetical protein
MGVTLTCPVMGISLEHIAIQGLQGTVALTTVWSGAAYFIRKDLVKFKSFK